MKSFLYQKSFQENTRMLHDHIDDDEADETLSLCDLEIYNDAATSQEFPYKENEISSSSSSSSSSSLEQDLFEFFTEEWSSTSLTSFLPSNTPPDNIIFCGKLIPSKQKPPFSPTRFPPNPTKPKKSIGLFRWNSDKRASESNTSTPPRSKSLPVTGKYGGKNDIVPKRVSIFQSPTKSRWYLFLFGMGGFPTKMELSDIRSRQVRRSSSSMFRMNGGDEDEEVGGSGRMGLIRALGCGGGNQTKTVGKASVGCFGGV